MKLVDKRSRTSLRWALVSPAADEPLRAKANHEPSAVDRSRVDLSELAAIINSGAASRDIDAVIDDPDLSV